MNQSALTNGAVTAVTKYFPLVKVDESTRTAYGLVTAEKPDKDGEICDYDAAKKAYLAWSKEAQDSTEAAGQDVSFGNIRLQHSLTIGGKAIAVPEFRDDKREIWLATTPVSDQVWDMLKGGFIRGFSQGGDYAWRVCNECRSPLPKGNTCDSCKKFVQTRYAPVVAEVSYVDNPCLKQATFSVVKTDGTTELRKFANSESAEEQVMQIDMSAIANAVAAEVLAKLRKAEAKTKHVAGEDLTADCFAYVGDKDEPKTWKFPVKFESEEKTKSHLRNALARLDQAKGIPEEHMPKVREKIEAAAKKHGIEVSEEVAKSKQIRTAVTQALTKACAAKGFEKNMYGVQRFAELLEDLMYLRMSAQYEADSEGDNSPLPADLQEHLENLAETFLAMAEEETKELTAASAAVGKDRKTMKATESTALAKAHKSIAHHIEKAKEAVMEHCEKMRKACDMHKEEMADCFGKMTKILGAEEATEDEGDKPGTSQPEPIDPKMGTPAHGEIVTKATYTKSEVDALVKSAVNEASEKTAAAILKAIKDEMEDKPDSEDGEDEDEPSEEPKKKHKKAASGIGNRANLPPAFLNAGPAMRVMPVHKSEDNSELKKSAKVEIVTEEDVKKAMNGDMEARAKLAKGIRMADSEDEVAVVLSALSQRG